MENHNELRDLHLDEYCVVFLDIMGQKRFLEEISSCEEHEADKRITKLSRPLLRFKQGLQKRAEEVVDCVKFMIEEKMAPKEQYLAKMLEMVNQTSYGVQQFSDSTLFYVKMGTPVSFLIILSFVEFIVFRMLDDIANGFVLRGGIEIGKGWELDQGCLCGQVVGNAYNMESQMSQWGRITVSEMFEKRVKGVCAFSGISGGCGYVSLLKPLVDAIQKDIDGMCFIDYLNPRVEEMYKRHHFSSDWFIDRIQKGIAFIDEEKNRFLGEVSKSSEAAKLALRYHIMQGYWESRMLMWANKIANEKL